MLSINNLSKQVAKNKSPMTIFDNISFDVKKEEFISFFGPNGCGKSTLLKIISGIDNPTSGTVEIKKNGKKTKIGYVFQNADYSMMPWKTVYENVIFGLESSQIDQKSKKIIVEKLLKQVNLYDVRDLYFCNLSGGMKQLTAICRALVFDPDILLLDEPFSALDHFVSKKIQSILVELWERLKITTIFISHNIDEAIYLSDKIVLFSRRPTNIIETVNINIPRPRSVSSLNSREFLKAKSRILSLTNHVE